MAFSPTITVIANAADGRCFCDRWIAAFGGDSPPRSLMYGQKMDEISYVIRPGQLTARPPVTGRKVAATIDQLDMLNEFAYDFMADIKPPGKYIPLRTERQKSLGVSALTLAQSYVSPEDKVVAQELQWSRNLIERNVTDGNAWLWQLDSGEMVAMACIFATPNGFRVGWVYTPDPHRKKGYASAIVHAICESAFSAGKKFVFLFADALNPQSNRVYAKLGFQRNGECLRQDVLAAPAPDPTSPIAS